MEGTGDLGTRFRQALDFFFYAVSEPAQATKLQCAIGFTRPNKHTFVALEDSVLLFFNCIYQLLIAVNIVFFYCLVAFAVADDNTSMHPADTVIPFSSLFSNVSICAPASVAVIASHVV